MWMVLDSDVELRQDSNTRKIEIDSDRGQDRTRRNRRNVVGREGEETRKRSSP